MVPAQPITSLNRISFVSISNTNAPSRQDQAEAFHGSYLVRRKACTAFLCVGLVTALTINSGSGYDSFRILQKNP